MLSLLGPRIFLKKKKKYKQNKNTLQNKLIQLSRSWKKSIAITQLQWRRNRHNSQGVGKKKIYHYHTIPMDKKLPQFSRCENKKYLPLSYNS